MRFDQYDIAEYLINKKVSVNTFDIYGDTPLLESMRNKTDNISKLLLCNGAKQDVKDRFDDIEKMLNDDAKLVTLASSNGKDPIDINGNTVKNIFENQDPFFVSVGNGKYKIAQGENPIVFGGEPEYLMNTDGGFFIIDLNKIKSDIITKFN